ncbi:MAG: hypothetical protein AB8B55_03980 [Mariniblastus sp.]
MALQRDSHSSTVWIGKYDQLPDTCCDCGLFTHNRVTVKHVDLVTQETSAGDGCGPVILTLIIHVALGPVGWLISALMSGGEGESKTKTVKQKSKIKISQCELCNGTNPPEVIESQVSSFAFNVHPKFKLRFEEMQAAAELDEF